MFVSGLKPEVFREEIYSRAFETLVDVIAETRHELFNYREGPISRKQGFTSKTPCGASLAKEMKVSNPAKTMDLKEVECFKCHKKGNYANKCPDAKGKDGKRVRQLEEPEMGNVVFPP